MPAPRSRRLRASRLEAAGGGVRGRHDARRMAGADAASGARPAACVVAARERAVARRRPQCRRRPRRRRRARRSRRAGVAAAGAGGRHAVDQGHRGLLAEFLRAWRAASSPCRSIRTRRCRPRRSPTSRQRRHSGDCARDLESALTVAGKLDLHPAPRILITGSLYLAGEVLAANGTPPEMRKRAPRLRLPRRRVGRDGEHVVDGEPLHHLLHQRR